MDSSAIWNVARAIMLSVGGAGALLFFLSSWLGKVWASRILEQDKQKYARELESLRRSFQHDLETLKAQLEATNRKLQGEVDRVVFVSRARFEAEFGALMRIWERIADVRSVLVTLEGRPRNDDDPARVKVWQQAVDTQVSPRIDALLTAVESQTPLYPKPLYDTFAELILKARVATTESVVDAPKDVPDYFKRRREFRKAFEALAIEAQEGIRQRLGELAIIRE